MSARRGIVPGGTIAVATLLALSAVDAAPAAAQRPDAPPSNAERPIEERPEDAAESRTCRLVTASNYLATDPGTPRERHYFRGPVHFTCDDDITLRADSAVGTPPSGLLLLIGSVSYEDSAKTLTSDRLRYFRNEDRLHATGDVELIDLRDGSTLAGPELEHWGVREAGATDSTVADGPLVAVDTPAVEDALAAEDSATAEDSVAAEDAPAVGDAEAPADVPAVGDAAADEDVPAPDLEPIGDDRTRPIGPRPGDVAALARPRPAQTPRTVVRGGAHATLWPSDSAARSADDTPSDEDQVADADAAGGRAAGGERDTAAVPLEVDADRIEIRGERWFHAAGDVRLARGPSRGFGREASYDRTTGQLRLDGDARIEDEAFDMLAARIEAFETASGGDPGRVHATGDAVLLAEELRLRAPDIHVFFQDGEMHRLVARSGEAIDTTAPARPHVDSPELDLVADSIDVLAPAQRLERVTAIGAAYAERAADSLPDASDLPEIARRDWVRGDTVIGHFTEETVAPDLDDEAPRDDRGEAVAADRGPETRAVLERIEAAGGSDGFARALFRMSTDSMSERPPPTEEVDAPTTGDPTDRADDASLAAADSLTADSMTVAATDSTAADSVTVAAADSMPTDSATVAAADSTVVDSIPTPTDPRAPTERPAVRDLNYVITPRLVLSLRDGSVSELEADGPLRGNYLERTAWPAVDDGAPRSGADDPPDPAVDPDPPPDGDSTSGDDGGSTADGAVDDDDGGRDDEEPERAGGG